MAEKISKRIPTKYKGVKYRMAQRVGGPGKERVYYIIYKKGGRLYEEKVGREHTDSMTPSRAAKIRQHKIEGRLQPRRYTLQRNKQALLKMNRLGKAFKKNGNPITALRAFCHAHDNKLTLPQSISNYIANGFLLYMEGKTESLDTAFRLNKENTATT